jgi:L,D-transpeptidase-like protein
MTLAPSFSVRCASRPTLAKLAPMGLATLFGLCLLNDAASAKGGRDVKREEFVQTRPAGAPVMAVVSLSRQRVTIYDADGWIMRAPVSSGQTGYETPAGVYSILQRKAEHFSNLYDDAAMPFMQRLTWSGIALHAGALPGYPASHGCVRMPHAFAERLFEVTRLGMRVIVMRDDIGPIDMSHPALFRPASGEPKAETAAGPSVVALSAEPLPVAPFQNLRRVAAAKAAEAAAASSRLEQARLVAAAKYREAAGANKTLRLAQGAKLRAEAHLREIERRLGSALEPAALAEVEEAKARAVTKLSETEAQLEAVQAEVRPTLDEVARVREAAQAAQQAKAAAEEEAREAKRKIAPISVFISRATQRLYVRQALQPLFESEVTIANPDEPLGTYVFTALAYVNDETDLRWNAVSMYGGAHAAQPQAHGQRRQSAEPGSETLQTDISGAKSALARITIPEETLDRISAVVSPGSALIVSDEALSRETGPATEFIVVMSGEPQGGIKIRRREPESRNRYERFMRRGPYGMGPSFW